jgi:imidazolonepropionase-like amidohydrolase
MKRRSIARRHVLGAAGALAAALVGLGPARAQPEKKAPADKGPRRAIVGAELWRGSAPRLERSVVVIEGERVVYVGDDESQAAGAERVSAQGKVVTAGFVDLLTRIGIEEVSLEDSTRNDHEEAADDDPIRAGFRCADGYDPDSSLIAVTRRAGLTSVGVIPVVGLVTGQSAWADLAGATPGEALAKPSLALHVNLTDPWHDGFGKGAATAILRLRELFADADSYRKNRAGYERRQVRELGASQLDLDAVVATLEGTLPLVVHVDRASDILRVLALAREQRVRLVLASAAEAWKVASAIASAKVPVILYPLDAGPRSFAALGAREDNAALCARAGATVALSTGESHNARKLAQTAGNAVRAGLDHQAAIAAVTEVPARVMGMDGYGTLAAGRVANVALWSGDPFELSTRVERLFIRGREVGLRSRQTALFERYR